MGESVKLTKEQNDVIEIRNRDVLVAASAGSGKTFVVAHRIISRIIKDNIDIDKILVVTFTNAAASELRERILKGFYGALKNKELDDNTKKHIQRQLTLINRAQISTIHSFCLSVIKNNFYVLGIEPNIKTIDENKAKIMLLESIDELVEQEYEEKTEQFLKVLELYKNEENVIKNIEKIYNFSRNMPYPRQWLEESFNKYVQQDEIQDLSQTDFGEKLIETVREKLQLMHKETQTVCDKIRFDKDFQSRLDILENVLEVLEDMMKISLYDELYSYIQNRLEFQRLPSSKCANEKLKKEVADIKKKVTNELKSISKMIYKDTKGIVQELKYMQDIVKWYVDMAMKLDNIYSAKKNSSGYIDFNDYEHLALKVLENSDICEEYKNKFDEIYIDEYQDTSYVQEIILKSISKNNRIMVGDVKQSIYSFRNAEPGLFNEKYLEYDIYSYDSKTDNPSKIILSKNFRSRDIVLNSINDIFKKIMSQEVGQCNYGKEEYLKYGDGFDNGNEKECITEVNILELENDDINYDEEDISGQEIEEINNTEKEANMIAVKINSLIENKFKLYDSKKKEYRNAEYRDIVILLRSVTGKAAIYEEVLKKHNIPVFSDTSESFYNGQEVGIILSFLKIIDNIYDDIALVSTMYSIIGKFTLDELVCIRNYNKKGYFYEAIKMAYSDENNIDLNLRLKIEKFLKLVKDISSYVKTFTIAETILKIYEDTGIYYSFYLEEMGKQKCANLDSLVEISRTFEKEERSSIYKFIQYIENMKERKAKGADTPKLLGEGENVVRILTIHKSKGLEYPIVFLADTAKKYNTMDMSDEILLDKKYGIGIDTFNTDLNISYSNVIKQAIKENINDKTLSEEERLLYVAMTRAKEKLYIYGTVKNYDKFKEKLYVKEAEKLSPVFVKDCNSYLKLIMLATSSEPSDSIKVNVISASDYEQQSSTKETKNMDRNVSCRESFLNNCKNIKENEQIIDKTFSNKYVHIGKLDIKKKYTVTELKKMSNETEDVDNFILLDENITIDNIKPRALGTNISNTGYGTIIHKILEKIDYKNTDIKEVEEVIEHVCKMHKNVNKGIIKTAILKFLNADIIDMIKEAKYIAKEQPFVIYSDLRGIPNIELTEKTYIQGVIDLHIKTKNNKNIIIDFKTDKVEVEEELINRYRNQLLVYKYGAELSTNENVDRMYIYSFHLNKFIEIK